MKQETELKQIKNFKIALGDVELFKKQIKVVKELVNEVRLKIDKDGFGFTEMTPCNVASINFKILSSSCIEYDVKEKTKVCLNLNNLYQILNVVSNNDVIVLSNDLTENKLIIEAKGNNIKKFTLPFIELDEKEHNPPQLEFKAKIVTDGKQLKIELKALDVIAESVTFNCHRDKLVLNADGDLSRLDTTIKADDRTTIKQTSEKDIVKSKYSMEYLKKFLEGSILTDDVTLEFNNDYPMRMTFKEVDKFVLEFIVAPRIENE